MDSFLVRKLRQRRIWRRVIRERLTEPLHLNVWSVLVALFGSYRAKVAHDLIVRQHNAYCILQCADFARSMGLRTISMLEFGVAAGAGLINMARIADRVTRATGIAFKIYGFDTGRGMPPPIDHRDHPDLYRPDDFPMDAAKLRTVLPENTHLFLGNVANTVTQFLVDLSPDEPIGYVVFDLDYYSSTRDALRVLCDADPRKYLPVTLTYFDDIHHDRHNHWCGELLAIDEFNEREAMRKLARPTFLPSARLYKRAPWLLHIFYLHALDHPDRNRPTYDSTRALENPYL
jgi:hypothetical protein